MPGMGVRVGFQEIISSSYRRQNVISRTFLFAGRDQVEIVVRGKIKG